MVDVDKLMLHILVSAKEKNSVTSVFDFVHVYQKLGRFYKNNTSMVFLDQQFSNICIDKHDKFIRKQYQKVLKWKFEFLPFLPIWMEEIHFFRTVVSAETSRSFHHVEEETCQPCKRVTVTVYEQLPKLWWLPVWVTVRQQLPKRVTIKAWAAVHILT